MTITLELPPEIEARLLAEAETSGIPVGELIKSYLQHAPYRGPRGISEPDVNLAFDEAADLIPEGIPPLSDEAMSRESIYMREDDWNR